MLVSREVYDTLEMLVFSILIFDNVNTLQDIKPSNTFIEQHRDTDSLLRRFHNILKIHDNWVKETEQKQAGAYGGNRCQREPLVSENIDNPLSDSIKKCTNPHRYNHPFPRRLQ